MCGIVGLISPAVPIRDDLLTAMRDRLVHRGPDNGSNWISNDKRIAFAHRRLSIIDTSDTANQPMASPDKSHYLVFNGEIYNYIELRSDLEQLGCRFSTQSDTEVLLQALILWGEDALLKLNGMFAFAFWDGRSRRMLIARDRFGEKPLFIGRGKYGSVAFASEMKAILANPLFQCSANSEAIARYGSGGWYEDDAMTFFEGIERLPAAHAAWYSHAGLELRRWRYWTPDYTNIDHSITPRQAVEKFTELLQRSVRMRLRADVPIGSSLSGGLDSSVIVGILAEERNTRSFTQNTFSACFPSDPTMSEENEIQAVVDHTDVKSITVNPNPKMLAEEASLLHWHQEEPFLSASIYLQWCVARLAKQNNTTVLLDGQGADELLAGYQFYYKQRQLDLLDTGRLDLALRDTSKFDRRLKIASSRFEQSHRRFNASVAYPVDEIRDLAKSRPEPFGYDYSVGVAPKQPGYRLRRTLSEALLYNSLPMLLRYADRNSMAFSREARLPYLDYDLVDFCISLPDDYLVRNGWQKWILRQSAGKIIPENIRWRADKVGYAAPLDTWLRNELRGWAWERITDSTLSGTPGYDRKALEALWNEHQSGGANHSWLLWRWVSLSEWKRLMSAGWWRSGLYRASY